MIGMRGRGGISVADHRDGGGRIVWIAHAGLFFLGGSDILSLLVPCGDPSFLLGERKKKPGLAKTVAGDAGLGKLKKTPPNFRNYIL